MKFFVLLVVRLSIVFNVFSLFGMVILIILNFKFFLVLSVNFYLVWNYGFFGCFIRKLSFRFFVIVDCDIMVVRLMVVRVLVNLCMVFFSFSVVLCRVKMNDIR